MKTQINIGNMSDVGKVRTANEDYFEAHKGAFGELIIVCDGMGGHKGGALASRLAVDTIKKHFISLNKNYDPKNELIRAFTEADRQLRERAKEDPELKEMGSTAVALLIYNGMAYTAHVGDSRIYMIRDNQIHQLTKDHSLVQQLMDAGIINEEQAKSHPNKNVITRTLGADKPYQPDISESIVLFKGDKYVLCTDGLSGYLDEKEILAIVSGFSPQDACIKLVQTANERGGRDNITVQIAEVVKGKRKPLLPRYKNQLIYASAVLAFAVVLALVYLFFPSGAGEGDKKAGEAVGEVNQLSDTGKTVEDTLKIIIADSAKAASGIRNGDSLKIKPETEMKNKVENKTLKKTEEGKTKIKGQAK